jgi:hypothetical protein
MRGAYSCNPILGAVTLISPRPYWGQYGVLALGKAKTRYVREHYKEVKVRRDFYEELRKLAEERGLSVPALIEEMFKHYTGPSTPAHTAPKTPTHTVHSKTPQPIQVSLWSNDPFWYLIRVGEGLYATEISLNLIQLSKLCNTGLLAEEVCEKAMSVR